MLIGIDVAKAELVIAARPSGDRWTLANDERGVQTLAERFTRERPALVIEWASRNEGALLENWRRLRSDQAPIRIAPLE